MDFGIYILTYPKDYHLSTALINSLRYFNPDLPITLLPGNGFDIDAYPIKGIPVLDKPDEFLDDTEYGYDRKFWSFAGHYDKFIYIDADIINLRPIGSLVDKILKQKGPFIFANFPHGKHRDWVNSIPGASREEQKRFYKVRIGNIDNIEIFDPQFDIHQYAFNGGLWASSKSSFSVEWFNELRSREQEFFRKKLNKEYSDGNLQDLFYGDQGKLSYLAYTKDVKVIDLYPDGHYVWGGLPLKVNLEDVLQGECDIPFVHWAGVPRPSHSWFCKSPLFFFYAQLNSRNDPYSYTFSDQKTVPAHEVWEYFSDRKSFSYSLWRTIKDVRWIMYPGIKNIVASAVGKFDRVT